LRRVGIVGFGSTEIRWWAGLEHGLALGRRVGALVVPRQFARAQFIGDRHPLNRASQRSRTFVSQHLHDRPITRRALQVEEVFGDR
jgi:hypothetical protein